MQQRRAGPRSPAVEVTLTWLGSYTAAFQRALDICGLLEADLVDADANRGTLSARTGVASVGGTPNIHITLRTQEGVTTVTVQVLTGLLEMGQSQRLAQRFVEIWDRMPDPAPAAE